MRQKKSYSLIELAELFCQYKFIINSSCTLKNVSTLEESTENDIAFFGSEKYRDAFNSCKAGLICVRPGEKLSSTQSYLITKEPSVAFQAFSSMFSQHKGSDFFSDKISLQASIAPNVKIGKAVTIYPFVVIDEDCTIGDRVIIYPHTFVGKGSIIGDDTVIYSNVTLREKTVVGNRVIVQPGAVIGSCGFGYDTSEYFKHEKVEQLGSVIIEDDVEIGANTTIDRARITSTIIGKGTKIDNLVQIGHNVKIGEDCLIVSQVGISGSAEIEDRVILGGQVGVQGHISVVSDVTILARGGVTKSVSQAGIYGGLLGVIPALQFLKLQVYQNKLSSLFKRIKKLEESK